MLTDDQKAFYQNNGYLRVSNVFDTEELGALSDELDWIFETWADHDAAWKGPWREKYMTDTEIAQAKLVAINDMHLHSERWARAVFHPRLVAMVADLIGPDVELHHTTLHAKPPETGSPFPLHQDQAFFGHEQAAYVDAILHIDPAPEEAGCLRFVPGSHRNGPMAHIRNGGAPHLPTDVYRLADTTAAPAQAGDVVFFCLWTIHGSDLNRSGRWRRVVRLGYRNPANRQIDGHALGRLGWVVRGRRPRTHAAEGLTR
jgi:ectoine hydroxylase-related dioxygenase (phytanoyl-CoA dioxygenase family)